MEQEEIKKQAKKILDRFSKALEKVKIPESRVEREKDRREEKEEPSKEEEEFRRIMLENAPEKDKDCIIAEKGEWVK